MLTTSTAMKEAVVLILDANETMATSYETDKSRFDCAKEVCLDLISDLMVRSKTNEVAVLMLKSPTTRHHFWEAESCGEVLFPNILELGGDAVMTGVNRPHPDLLRQVQALQVTRPSTNLRGDFCDGLVVAADALFQRTAGKKYERRIVLITDAEHKVKVDSQQLLVVLDSLRAMECRLEVIGMNFESQAEFERAAVVKPKEQKIPMKQEEDSATEAPGEDMEEEADNNNNNFDDDHNDEEEDLQWIKSQNEKLLLSLTEKTGGFVVAAKELQPILQKILGQRLPKSTRRKVEFQIAPGLVLDARFSLLLSKASTPVLKKQVVELQENERPDNPDAQVVKDESGREVTHDFQTLITHWDPEQDTKELTDIAQGYRYGSDIVPMSGYDMTGLLRPSTVKLTVLGYLKETQVPRQLRIGPPYALAGADSFPSCVAIAALAVALTRKKQVGIATLVKTKDADPILVGLFPLSNSEDKTSPPRHLCIMQLPFRGDVTNLSLEPLVSDASPGKQAAADFLIDSLMLPPGTLNHTRIPNPYLRSFHQTVIQRILRPDCSVVSVRSSNEDPMTTPPAILKQAQPAIDGFKSAFPLTKATTNSNQNNESKSNKRGRKTYHDFVD